MPYSRTQYLWDGLDPEVKKQLCHLADFPTYKAESFNWSDMEVSAILTLGRLGLRGTEDYFFQAPVARGHTHKTADLLFWKKDPQLIVELYGCWVHQHQKCFGREMIPVRKKDQERVQFLVEEGYRVHVIWNCENLEDSLLEALTNPDDGSKDRHA